MLIDGYGTSDTVSTWHLGTTHVATTHGMVAEALAGSVAYTLQQLVGAGRAAVCTELFWLTGWRGPIRTVSYPTHTAAPASTTSTAGHRRVRAAPFAVVRIRAHGIGVHVDVAKAS